MWEKLSVLDFTLTSTRANAEDFHSQCVSYTKVLPYENPKNGLLKKKKSF